MQVPEYESSKVAVFLKSVLYDGVRYRKYYESDNVVASVNVFVTFY